MLDGLPVEREPVEIEEFPSFDGARAARPVTWLGVGVLGSTGLHAASFGLIYLLTVLGVISIMPARVQGRKTIISMEMVFSPAPTPEHEPEVKTDVFEAPQFEPLEVAHENVPLKVEVSPDHVQIQQQVFVLRRADLIMPVVDQSPVAAAAPVLAQANRAAEPDHRNPSRTEKREVTLEAKRRPTPDVLAAFTPPSVPIPPDAGVEETPASLSPNNPPPIYPAEAIARGWIGQVELRVTIAPTGLVSKIEVASSSGHPVLDAAAYHAVRRWRFVPMRIGSTPVESVLRVPVHFLPK